MGGPTDYELEAKDDFAEEPEEIENISAKDLLPEQLILGTKKSSLGLRTPNQPLKNNSPSVYKASFVQGDLAERALEQYARETKGYELLQDVFTISNEGILEGSTSLGVCYMNQILQELGCLIANPGQIARIFSHEIPLVNMRHPHLDLGLVFRSKDEGSKIQRFLSRNLSREISLKKRGRLFKTPVAIANTDLDLIKDRRAEYGLKHDLHSTLKCGVS